MNQAESIETAREKRKRLKSQQIIEAATKAFLESGYGGVSMDRIVEMAGVSKRTLYAYYENKQELFTAVMQVQLDKMFSASVVGGTQGQSLSKRLNTLGFGFSKVSMQPEPLALYRIMIGEATRFPDLAQSIYDEVYTKLLDHVAEVLKKAPKGAGTRFANPLLAAEHFLDHLIGTTFMTVALGVVPPLPDVELKKQVKDKVSLFLKAHQA